jgi:hypothetical protein
MNVEFLTRAPFYRCSLRHDLAHNTRYVLMFASGCLFWWPKAGADHLPRRLSCRGRMTLVFAGLPFELFVVIALMSYGKPVRSSGMMFLSVFVLITLAAALVRLGSAGPQPTARQAPAKCHIESGVPAPAPRRRQPVGPGGRPHSVLTICPQTVRTQLAAGRADPCRPAVQPEDLQ